MSDETENGQPIEGTVAEEAPAAPVSDEPQVPGHLRLEAGHMSELMDHVRAWVNWRMKQ